MRAFALRAEQAQRLHGQLDGLGLKPEVHPSGLGEHIAADPMGLTAVPGVWVAGNVTDPLAQVIGAASAGVTAGAAINADLIAEETGNAVAAYRAAHTG
jgi:thioredoxin reductase